MQAELAKIWTNILRYATFALPNLLMMDCEQHGANVFEVIDLINRDYPRGGIASPGLTAGTCLRKDFTFSEERSNAPGDAARRLARQRVGAAVPRRGHEAPARRISRERKVAVLGLAFKRDTDDERDSLSHKLIRLLERELADVAVHDPSVSTPSQSLRRGRRRRRRRRRGHEPLRLRRAGAAAARSPSWPRDDCLVVDPWNAFGSAQVFAYAAEVAALHAPELARHAAAFVAMPVDLGHSVALVSIKCSPVADGVSLALVLVAWIAASAHRPAGGCCAGRASRMRCADVPFGGAADRAAASAAAGGRAAARRR